MSEDRCVCCGAVVPEGRMVCPQCEGRTTSGRWEKPSEYGMGHKFNNLGVVCSACVSWSDNPYNFCPHCGADMRGTEDGK